MVRHIKTDSNLLFGSLSVLLFHFCSCREHVRLTPMVFFRHNTSTILITQNWPCQTIRVLTKTS